MKTKKKRYVIGRGYPWYSDSFQLECQENLKNLIPVRKTNHSLGAIQLFSNPVSNGKTTRRIMLDPKNTHNGKKYRLILEEI